MFSKWQVVVEDAWLAKCKWGKVVFHWWQDKIGIMGVC